MNEEMRPAGDGTSGPTADFQRILDELTYLRSLFERRLLDDKTKERAFDELLEQLEFARRGLLRQFLVPIVSDLLLICDRLEREPSPDESHFLIVDEILEVCRRRGLTEIEWKGTFDPRLHEMVKAVPVADPALDQVNIDLERRGFIFGDLTVRPARVFVGTCQVQPSDRSSITLEMIESANEGPEASDAANRDGND